MTEARSFEERFVSAPDNKQKYALECLRLAADCTQSAREIEAPVLRAHFTGMATVWTTLAERGPTADPKMIKLN
jgi:hypothetical protein